MQPQLPLVATWVKYERWVEPDPIYFRMIREAWGLLLTDHYTLAQICEELTRRGYTRSTGRPWSWRHAKTGELKTAENRLQTIFHTPFYAGWIVSEPFDIKLGEIRGHWEPIISTEEFNRGIEILRTHDTQKSRMRRCFYLLRNLLWIRQGSNTFKMFGSTPKGRSQSYAYYITHVKPEGQRIHIPCNQVDDQIPGWLKCIEIDPLLIPSIRDVYANQVFEATQGNRDTKLREMKRQLSGLKEEEARLGRLYITGKTGEETYEKLRTEWQVKLRSAEINIADMERETKVFLDDLDIALVLIANISSLYSRLKESDQSKTLQIITKRIIVNTQGEIIDHELRSPFVYLRSLVDEFQTTNVVQSGSKQLRPGAPLNDL